MGLSEVAFPGLGPGEGMLWNLFRKLLNQLVMGCCFFLSFFLFFTILVCCSCSFQNYKHVSVAMRWKATLPTHIVLKLQKIECDTRKMMPGQWMGDPGLNFQNNESLPLMDWRLPPPDTRMFCLYDFWPRFLTCGGERQWFWNGGILLLSWVTDFQWFDPNYLHSLGHPTPYFSLPKHSDCNHSKHGYFRLTVCMVLFALVGFFFFYMTQFS